MDSDNKLTKYVYGAKNKQGQTVTGTIEAVNDRVATEELEKKKELFVITIEPEEKETTLFDKILNRVTLKDRAIFARQLSTMIGAGFPLVQAIRVISVQTKSDKLREILTEVVTDVEKGHSLSTAMAKHSDIFTRVFVSVIRSGEASGTLAQVLKELADEMEKDYTFNSRLRSALVYPAFIIVAMIVVGILLMIKVIPQLKQIFEDAGAALPWSTRVLIFTSNVLTNYWWGVIIAILLIYLGFRAYLATESGKNFWDSLRLKIPVIGNLETIIVMARFARIMSLLAKTGIPILEALNIITDVIENSVFKDGIKRVAKEVERGVPMSVPLSKEKAYPQMIPQMISVGEQTGKVESVLEHLARYYDEEVERVLKTVASVVEPIIIVIVGIGVGIMVFAIIVPIYQLATIM